MEQRSLPSDMLAVCVGSHESLDVHIGRLCFLLTNDTVHLQSWIVITCCQLVVIGLPRCPPTLPPDTSTAVLHLYTYASCLV
ncbi:hypothetical protein RSAG8_10120, partial [Rhizoctonia solani AG-8 WAC10335]